MDKKYSKTFCSLAYMSLSTSPSGNLRVCCESVSGQNLIKDTSNKSYKFYNTDLKTAWHSEFYKKLRDQFSKGEKPKICEFCFQKEKAGVESARQAYNKKWLSHVKDSSNTPPIEQIKYLDIKIGNTCNLKCRMCGPFNSSSWVKEWKDLTQSFISTELESFTLKDEQRFKDSVALFKKMDFLKFANQFKSLEEVYFTGGEPFLIKEYDHLLSAFIKTGQANKITLKYNTNLTQVSQKALETWKNFKSIHLKISLDGFNQLNDYIRYPSKWSVIEDNLLVIEQFKKNHKLQIQIDCTVQMYNILTLGSLLKWVKTRNYPIYFNILSTPRFLNIRVLPSVLKKTVQESLLPFQTDFDIQPILSYMNSENQSSQLKEFFTFTKFLDKSRNQDVFSFLPELKEYQNLSV